MGYDVHITRSEEWWADNAPRITLEEWKSYVASDPSIRIDNAAQASTGEGGVLRYESEGLAVWTAYSGHTEDANKAWLDFRDGRIVVKNPDEEILKKMHSIAEALSAKVQGDDGEIYVSDGEPQAGDKGSTAPPSQPSKPWWRFW